MNNNKEKRAEPPVKAVFFDLDGTVMATACDLAIVLNKLLIESQRPPVSQKEVETLASNGATAIVKSGFDMDTSAPRFLEIKEKYLKEYQKKLEENCTTPLFSGIQALLNTLEANGLLWGIVTNKPKKLTLALLEYHKLTKRCAAIVCPEDVSRIKPSPEPLLKAATIAHVKPENCIYVGDHERDILSGKAAGMLTIAVSYGYIVPRANPSEWNADLVVADPAEISDWILSKLNSSSFLT